MITKTELLSKIKGNIVIEGECITWIGSKLGTGSGTSCHNEYGTVCINNKNYRIHRLVYSIFVHRISSNIDILHKCNNKSCINTDHLYIGTASDNLYDAYRDKCFSDGRKSFTQEELDKVVELFSQKVSLRYISRQLKCDHHKVERALHKLKLL